MTAKVIPDFNNTEIAFRSKSDGDLKRAYWLFRLMNNTILTKSGVKLIAFALKMNLPVKNLIRSTIFKHFCGGETIKGCEPTIMQLASGKVGSILDYSVEEGQEERGFKSTSEKIIRTIQRAKGDPAIPFTVFKVTGIANMDILEKLDAGKDLTVAEQAAFFRLKARVNDICRTAYENGVRVLIDAEETWMQDTIDSLTFAMIRSYNREKAIVYNTYQMYRKDKLASLESDIELAEAEGFILGAKLVRGAYMEKERKRAEELGYQSPIHPDKNSTDRDYDNALESCISHLKNVAFIAGTHNEESCEYLAGMLSKNGIPVNHPHVYFAQLLGMADNLSFNLAAAGYNVAKYVPYGPVKAVMPYLFRRAEENTSVSGRALRELELISAERKRRRR